MHFMFVLIHIAALLFGTIFLLITIPLHIIFTAINNKKEIIKEEDWTEDLR